MGKPARHKPVLRTAKKPLRPSYQQQHLDDIAVSGIA
jgi:hypothetical protein